MTIYGGEEGASGTIENGFFITCAKCGWHSEISVSIEGEYVDVAYIRILCGKCGNVARVYEEHHYMYGKDKND